MLKDKYNIALLSRGYKRKSKGFILADDNSSASLIGDEPFQIKQKFKDITVAVMGCVVNGPGEGKHADIGIAGGKDKVIIRMSLNPKLIIDKVEFDKSAQTLYLSYKYQM